MSAPLLGLVGLIYLYVSYSEYCSGNNGLAVAFIGYAFSNIGLILAAMK